MADVEKPKENASENADKAVRSVTEQLSTLCGQLSSMELEDATKSVQSMMDQLKVKVDMKAAQKDVLDRLNASYAYLKEQMDKHYPENEMPKTIEDLYQKFQENTVEFRKEPLSKVGAYINGIFEKIPMPGFMKNWMGASNGAEMGAAIGRMGQRLWYNFLLGADKLVPAFFAPLFGGAIDQAREALILMDAEDGFNKAIRSIQKRKGFESFNVKWDPLTWETWRAAFDA